MKKILFQGDSITDAVRRRESDGYLGCGYVTLVSADLGYERAGEFEFVNRGISGERTVDILARIKRDLINLSPDYMSILVGVNDIWHEIDRNNGVEPKYYEIYYDMIINQAKEALPNLKIMILEPFLLKGSATEEKWAVFAQRIKEYAEISKRVADRHGLVFVPLQEKFNEALKYAPADYWTADGVHPTVMGSEIIKREWLKGFKELEEK